jgi:DNA-binding MarR family transcriptional regulator
MAAEARPGPSLTKSKTDPGVEAWTLMNQLYGANRGRFISTLSEFDLWPPQWFALQALEEPTPMGHLAKLLHCDSSNVTGITDRLEQRGYVERRPAEHDRRVKLLVLTRKGRKLRDEIHERLSVPPAPIAGLSGADQRTLRDVMRRAMEAENGAGPNGSK